MPITVVTPPSATALTTLATVKDELGITDSSQDARLTRLIAQASSAIEEYCDRLFGVQVVDETLSWNERARLVLSVAPIVEISSVTFDGTALDAAEWELESRGAGLIFLRSGIGFGRVLVSNEVHVPGITRDARGEEGRKLWTVRYTGGWWLPSMSGSPTVEPLLPSDLEAACIDLVRTMHARRKNWSGDVASERLGDWNASYRDSGSSGMPESVEKRISRYVRLRA
jgi:hypothetical protein